MRMMIFTLAFLSLCCVCIAVPNRAFASSFPRVDQDVKAYDDHIAELNTIFNKLHSDPNDKIWVQAKLQHMVDVDQYMRKETMNIPFDHQYSDAEKQEYQHQMMSSWSSVDTANTADLKILLKIYTWFKISIFGAQADNNAWLLVQHADLDPKFQKSVLSTLEGLWQQGETKPANYAYLFDRVVTSWIDQSKRTLQRYGTQGSCIGPGTWEPLPMEAPSKIDVRRASVGLGTEADYIKVFKSICH